MRNKLWRWFSDSVQHIHCWWAERFSADEKKKIILNQNNIKLWSFKFSNLMIQAALKVLLKAVWLQIKVLCTPNICSRCLSTWHVFDKARKRKFEKIVFSFFGIMWNNLWSSYCDKHLVKTKQNKKYIGSVHDAHRAREIPSFLGSALLVWLTQTHMKPAQWWKHPKPEVFVA